MLTSIEKEVFRNLLNFIEENLVGKNNFNIHNCEIRFQKLDEVLIKKYTINLISEFYNKHKELGNQSIYSFLVNTYSSNSDIFHRNRNSITKIFPITIRNLQVQYSKYEKSNNNNNLKEILIKSHTNLINQLDLFLSIENLI